jgi:hypothetical protein
VAQGDIETYYEGGQWKNKREGTDRAFGAGYSSKHEAEAAGRESAQADKVEHVIKNQDGQTAPRTATATTPGTSRADPQSMPWHHSAGGTTKGRFNMRPALLRSLCLVALRVS